ncbi:hypothetical protein ACFL2G_00265 [Candidatus Omnitrophota bacterium]
MIIRAEKESEINAIFEITKQAFENHPKQHVLALPFTERMASGVITHHHAFAISNNP